MKKTKLILTAALAALVGAAAPLRAAKRGAGAAGE
jgi:hypothetical protein